MYRKSTTSRSQFQNYFLAILKKIIFFHVHLVELQFVLLEQLLAIQIQASLKLFDRVIHPASIGILDFKLLPFVNVTFFLLGNSLASEF